MFFLGPLGPNLTLFHYVLYFSDIFFLWSFLSFYFLYFLLQKLKQLSVGRLVFYFVRSFWLSAFNSRADNTVINYCKSFCKFKAWCLHSTGEVSFLPATSFTVSLYLHHLLENSLGSSTIYGVFYAINWVHKLSVFENPNPCDNFLVRSIVEASGRASRKPVRKAEPITPEILGLILQHYGESSNLLDIRFVCMCLLAYAGLFRISELLSISRSNIVTEGLYHKIFIEVSKTDKYREGSWVYIAKTGNFTCPYTYLIKYLEAARIPCFPQNFIIFQILTVRQEFEGQFLLFKASHCWQGGRNS